MQPNTFLPILAWVVAFAWFTRVLAALRGLPTIPNLLLPEHDLTPVGAPALTVIVPARNEAEDVELGLRSLLGQDYPNLKILAIDDRSTDATGQIMDTLAAAHPEQLRVLHITELPPGWLGKTHAMALAASQATSDFLLFTDADVLFRPDALRRALAHAVATQADHLVLLPTTLIRRWDEAALLGFFQILGLWGARPWAVANPRARDAIGVGAFNLMRRTAYQQTGGFAALRMEIVEDLALARRIKAAGLRQRIAFGRGLVSLHWAAGAHGIVNVMTKNAFAVVAYRIPLVLLGCAWLTLFCIAPFVGMLYAPTLLPALVSAVGIATLYRLLQPHSGLNPRNVLFAPFAAALFLYALLRSTFTTLRQGGVVWRGTFYPLGELRRNTAPLFYRRTRAPRTR